MWSDSWEEITVSWNVLITIELRVENELSDESTGQENDS